MAKKPSRFYKFQPFGPHTGLNLVMLVEKGSLYMPMKSALNDPTDCEPNISVEKDVQSIRSSLKRISRLSSGGFYVTMASKFLENIDAAENEGKQLFSEDTPEHYLPNMPAGDRGYVHIKGFIRSRIGMPRVFSMSAGWDIPQMWSYYADSHRGFCLELSGFPPADPDFIFERVNYADKRPQVILDDVINLEDGSPKSKRNLSMIYCEKSNAWSEEDEYRIVSRNTKGARSRTELSLPSGDFYNFTDLKVEGIYFGLRCDEQNMKFVTKIFEERFEGAEAPAFYKVKQEVDSYDLERIAMTDPIPFWIPTVSAPVQINTADDDNVPF
ncbi:DUF2971 domain-containing protein [Devosia sp. WQ 349]|uniref:DUF2971 domain-containing protein n=1 Tax=Devosia sp. WQ 349K1 TaxID=2800329 RepID=UPI001904EE15|nr:DUF2971 domain-containing protein [Devosia sp. WQ 349K1]MBK1792897.1 DUF2971 domain-containing protein [Devosia sp. WQ 349K1]